MDTVPAYERFLVTIKRVISRWRVGKFCKVTHLFEPKVFLSKLELAKDEEFELVWSQPLED